jgi:hypothetical protein
MAQDPLEVCITRRRIDPDDLSVREKATKDCQSEVAWIFVSIGFPADSRGDDIDITYGKRPSFDPESCIREGIPEYGLGATLSLVLCGNG